MSTVSQQWAVLAQKHFKQTQTKNTDWLCRRYLITSGYKERGLTKREQIYGDNTGQRTSWL